MDKIFSTRIDENVIRKINLLAREFGKSKKSIISNAITLYVDKLERENKFDVFERTSGAWNRKESPDEVVKKGRDEFRKSFFRHQT